MQGVQFRKRLLRNVRGVKIYKEIIYHSTQIRTLPLLKQGE
jgi:hypothetical protein